MKIRLAAISLIFFSLQACSSAQKVHQQAYAKLSNQRTFEYEFPIVWKGIEETFRTYKVVSRDPKEVDTLEMNKLKQRTLETDWIYGQSRDKYHEYKVGGSPRKVYLQTRYKVFLEAKRVMGGVQVEVKTDEEVEELKQDGTPAGYSGVDEKDSSRANEVLEKIQQAILSAAP